MFRGQLQRDLAEAGPDHHLEDVAVLEKRGFEQVQPAEFGGPANLTKIRRSGTSEDGDQVLAQIALLKRRAGR
jgi:hypothetical protein